MSGQNGLYPVILQAGPTEADVTAYSGLLPFLDLWVPPGTDKQTGSRPRYFRVSPGESSPLGRQ